MPVPDAYSTVGFYLGLNGLILIWLSINVGRVRSQLAIPLGDGGKPQLLRAMPCQANFIEYVLFAFFLVIATATAGTPPYVLHIFGVLLTVGRFLHALHFTREKAPMWMRGAGTVLTMLVSIFGSAGLVGARALRWTLDNAS